MDSRSSLPIAALAVVGLLLVAPAPAQPPASVAEMVPAGTIVHLELSTRAIAQRGGNLALSKILTEPEVQQFFAPFTEFGMGAGQDQIGGFLEGFGFEMKDLEALMSNMELSISFMGVRQVKQKTGDYEYETTIPEMIVTLDGGSASKVVTEMVDALRDIGEGQGVATFEQVKVGEHKAIAIKSDGAPFEPLYAFAGSRLVMATSKELLAGALGGTEKSASLASHASFAAAAGRVRRSGSPMFAYIDFNRLWDIVDDEAPAEAKMLVEALGLSDFKSISYGMEFDGAGIRDRIYVHAPGSTMLSAVLPANASGLRTVDMVPAGAAYYQAGAFSSVGLHDWIKKAVSQLPEEARREFDQGIAQFEQMMGFKLRDELLAGFGPEYAMYASFEGQSLIPDVGVLIQLADDAKAKKCMEAFKGQLPPGAEVKTFAYRGHDISWFDLSKVVNERDMPAFKPTWTQVNGYLLFTMWPQSAKKMISGLEHKRPRLSSHTDFKRLLAHLREGNPAAGTAAITYVDMKRAASFVLDNAMPLLQSVIPSEIPLPNEMGGMTISLDMAALPMSETITKHLFGVLGATQRTSEGIYSEIYSPFGYFSASFLTGLVPAMTLGVASGRTLESRPSRDEDR